MEEIRYVFWTWGCLFFPNKLGQHTLAWVFNIVLGLHQMAHCLFFTLRSWAFLSLSFHFYLVKSKNISWPHWSFKICLHNILKLFVVIPRLLQWGPNYCSSGWLFQRTLRKCIATLNFLSLICPSSGDFPFPVSPPSLHLTGLAILKLPTDGTLQHCLIIQNYVK